jgi:putative ABC transport system permease protein
MKLKDIVSLSVNNLSHRGLRSWLTILGIVVGIGAVVSIISMGTGLQRNISSQLGGLGADIVTVSPGGGRASGLVFGERNFGGETAQSQNITERDAQVIKTIPDVQFVDGIISGRVSISYLTQSSTVSVQGVDPLAWKEMTTVQLGSGRYLNPGDSNVVVIGYGIANSMFKQPLTLNTQINIEGQVFKVVGILQQSGGFGGSDNAVYMPITAARTVITGMTPTQLSSIQVKVSDPSLVSDVVNSITERLLISRHVTNSTKDFTVTSSQQIQSAISSVMSTLNIFLTGIAAISLLVGGIGIANTMFTSVMERTKQIGTLKALGATNFEIMKLFMFESAMIGLIGGLIGIFLGFVGSGIISDLGIRLAAGGGGRASTSITLITPQLILFALGFSVLIGAVSGIIPARNASKLQPVEALRYE